MHVKDFIYLLEKNRRFYHFLGDELAGVVVVLDLEGRIFAVLHREVLNRVNPEAFSRQSSHQQYLNPGGDALWPAPEGSRQGYFYTTGKWSVPASLRQLRYTVQDSAESRIKIAGEVDLVNNSGLGVPAVFQRIVSLKSNSTSLTVTVEEGIRYLGPKSLSRKEFLLAPWTLNQFDSGPGCVAFFPAVPGTEIQDFYQPSNNQRSLSPEGWKTLTDGSQRYQIGLGTSVEWIEFYNPERQLRVRRQARNLPYPYAYIDIADRPCQEMPGEFGVRYSIYSDPTFFMELEAAGGCPEILNPGETLTLTVTTTYTLIRK